MRLTFLAMSSGALSYRPFYQEMNQRVDLDWVVSEPQLARHYSHYGFPPVLLDVEQRSRNLRTLSDQELLTRLEEMRVRLGVASLRPLFWSSEAYHTETIYSIYDQRRLWTRALAIYDLFSEYLEQARPDFVIQDLGGEAERRVMRLLCTAMDIDTVVMNYVPFREGIQPSANEYSKAYGILLRDVSPKEVADYLDLVRSASPRYVFGVCPPNPPLRDRAQRFISDPDRLGLVMGMIRNTFAARYRTMRKFVGNRLIRWLAGRVPTGRRMILFTLGSPVESILTVSARGFHDQYMLVKQIALHMPEDHVLCVKCHPHYMRRSDLRELWELKGLQDVYFASADTDLRDLLARTSVLITVGSTVGFEALALGVPVITLGESIYSGRGLTIDIDKIGDLSRAIDAARNFSVSQDAVTSMAADWLSQAFNGMYGWQVDVLAADLLRFCDQRQAQKVIGNLARPGQAGS